MKQLEFLLDDWRLMESAPKTSVEIQVITKGGKYYPNCHYAENLSGEEQPVFMGWFVPVKAADGRILYFSDIKPKVWRP